MATFTKFEDFIEQLGKGVHDLNSDTLKVYLTNATPSVSDDAIKTDLAEITNEHGYAPADIQNAFTETSGTGTMTATDVVFTASGGSFGPFRYIVIYNDTAASDNLIGYADYGSSITVNSGETFTVDFGASVITIS